MYKPSLKLVSTAVLMSGLTTQVMAEEAVEVKPNWEVVGGVSLVSDYIFRGQTQSWGKPSLQAFVEADHASGFYVGAAAESVSGHWLPGADIEIDYFTGFRGNLPGAASVVGFDVGLIYYTYPSADWDKSAFTGTDSNKLDTAEASVALTYNWLTFKTGTTLTEYFGWNPNNSGVGVGFSDLSAGVTGNTKYSYYYELDAAYEVMPTWTISGQVGKQVIKNATGLDIAYYKVGVAKNFDSGWSVGASYSATNEPDAYKDFVSLENTTSKYDIAKDMFFVSVGKSF